MKMKSGFVAENLNYLFTFSILRKSRDRCESALAVVLQPYKYLKSGRLCNAFREKGLLEKLISYFFRKNLIMLNVTFRNNCIEISATVTDIKGSDLPHMRSYKFANFVFIPLVMIEFSIFN